MPAYGESDALGKLVHEVLRRTINALELSPSFPLATSQVAFTANATTGAASEWPSAVVESRGQGG